MKNFKYVLEITKITLNVIGIVINVATLISLWFGLPLLPVRAANILGNGVTILPKLLEFCEFLYRKLK